MFGEPREVTVPCAHLSLGMMTIVQFKGKDACWPVHYDFSLRLADQDREYDM